MRQPILWLVSGLLLGIGFVSAFSGGLLLLVAGLTIAIVTAVRNRRHWRGWSAFVYGLGASAALLLSPYVFRQSRCVQNSDPGCFQTFTLAIFAVALALALLGLGLAVMELRRWRGSGSGHGGLG